MKTLAEYLTEHAITQRAFAERLGVSRGHMSEIVSRAKSPSLQLALRIVAETGGSVHVSSLLSDPSTDAPLTEAS